MHLYPRKRNVAAQVAEELKTVTYMLSLLWRNAEKPYTKHLHCQLTSLAHTYMYTHARILINISRGRVSVAKLA